MGPQVAKDWSKQHWGSASKTPAATKAALRRALVVEQRGLCAYCLGGISLRGSGEPPPPEGADVWETAVRGSRLTVEHWRARETFPLECLEYELLLGVCDGGTEMIATNTDPRQLHCDKRRLSADLSLSPLSPSQMALTRYRTGGRVEWPDDALNREANEVLGLNTPALVRARATSSSRRHCGRPARCSAARSADGTSVISRRRLPIGQAHVPAETALTSM